MIGLKLVLFVYPIGVVVIHAVEKYPVSYAGDALRQGFGAGQDGGNHDKGADAGFVQFLQSVQALSMDGVRLKEFTNIVISGTI